MRSMRSSCEARIRCVYCPVKQVREKSELSTTERGSTIYHWISYGCVQKYQQHRDKHQGLTAYLVGLGEQRLAQWWRNFEDLRQAGFYGKQAGESEVQEAFDLLERIRTWATS